MTWPTVVQLLSRYDAAICSLPGRVACLWWHCHVASVHETLAVLSLSLSTQVEYEALPAVMSIAEAIEADSFHPQFDRTLTSGDVDAAFASLDVACIVEGEARMGGQEHFYLEPHCNYVVPIEADEFLLVASTQVRPPVVVSGCQPNVRMHAWRNTLFNGIGRPRGLPILPRLARCCIHSCIIDAFRPLRVQDVTKHQKLVSKVLGIPQHKLCCKTKRLGGGFGGKETRGAFLHCATAVAAFHTRRPVRMTLERQQDMQITGHRHAFVGRYRVAATANGRVLALDLQLFSNAGMHCSCVLFLSPLLRLPVGGNFQACVLMDLPCALRAADVGSEGCAQRAANLMACL
jgi:xanthine dehydrogenase molybdopterin-binding subunit B